MNLLVAILEVDGPDSVRIKKGPDAGKDASVLRLLLGEEEGGVCKLTAWRETADTWGGQDLHPDETTNENEVVKKGDIVYIESSYLEECLIILITFSQAYSLRCPDLLPLTLAYQRANNK